MVAVADQYNSAITSIQLKRTQRSNKPKRKRPRYWLSLEYVSILGLCLQIKKFHSCPPV
mgnify:FL=1